MRRWPSLVLLPSLPVMGRRRQSPGRLAVVIGPLPPPRHGLAVATASAVEALSRTGWDTVVLDTSPGRIVRDVAYYWLRVTRMFVRLGEALRLRWRSSELVYAGVSGGRGLLFDGLLVRIVSGGNHQRTLIHHHSYQYVNKSSLWMRFFIRIQPIGATHLVLCEHMRTEFCRIYGVPEDQVLVVGNLALRSVAGDLVTDAIAIDSGERPLSVGFLGTLSLEKGLGLFVQVADRLHSCSPTLDVSFSCAGPVSDEFGQHVAQSTSKVAYLGVLSGDEVRQYLGGLDLILFPSMYVNEAQPNVIIESLGAGVPIMCTPRGCTRDLLSPHLEDLIVEQQDFVEAATSLIVSLSADRSTEGELRRRVGLQFAEINESASRQAELLRQLFS